jgi:cell wall-associated NlpC family hydrolase
VLAQINQIDHALSQKIEAYNGARYRLGQIEHDQQVNRHDLGVARGNLKHAQKALAARLVSLYTADRQNTTLDVLLGAKSLDDLLSSLDTVNRVSDQDATVLREVISFRKLVQKQEHQLATAHSEQAGLVSSLAAQKAQIEGQLAQRQQLLSSIRSEIARLRAAERAQQAELAVAARARLATGGGQQPPVGIGIGAITPDGASVVPASPYTGVVGIAMRYLGTPYVWAGASPAGFDCSGFTMYVFAQVGISLPHFSGAQYAMGVPVAYNQLEPGDLVFFEGLGHVGIYIGGGQFIHSPHTGDVVKISSLAEAYYSGSYVGARRIL